MWCWWEQEHPETWWSNYIGLPLLPLLVNLYRWLASTLYFHASPFRYCFCAVSIGPLFIIRTVIQRRSTDQVNDVYHVICPLALMMTNRRISVWLYEYVSTVGGPAQWQPSAVEVWTVLTRKDYNYVARRKIEHWHSKEDFLWIYNLYCKIDWLFRSI